MLYINTYTHCFLNIRLVLVYVNKRGNIIALTDEWKYQPPTSTKYKIWKLLNLFTKFRKILECGNMLLFFVEGIYPCLLHRLAQYRMVSSNHTIVDSHVRYSSGINKAQLYVKFRQLLWVLTVASIATCSVTYNFDNTQSIVRAVLSNINYVSSSCKQAVSRYIDKIKTVLGGVNAVSSANDNTGSINVDDLSDAPNLRCNICYVHTANVPYISQCNHIFCYLCISSEMEDIQHGIYACPVCHKVIHEVHMYRPDGRGT